MSSASHYPSDDQIWDLARQEGLDPFPVICEAVPATILYEFAAYLIPGRMSHWSYGKAYHAMKTRYDYGLNKLYEMVINANPAYAFLLDSNSDLENTFVRAHVMGHVDFFKHNLYFAHTQRDMLDVVARHADRIRQYEFEYGQDVVERFLDATLSIQEHVAEPLPPLMMSARQPAPSSGADGWTDLWQSLPSEHHRQVKPSDQDDRDVLRFIMEHSDELEEWQRDVVAMVHDEMVYFWPQLRTKIMNEGWASLWHVRLMRALELTDADVVNFARLHAAVTSPIPYQINPYAIGYAIFRHIVETRGIEAAFFVRTIDDDVSFLRNYLTESLVEDLHLYVFGPEQDKIVVKSRHWELVRDRLVKEFLHGGLPIIEVADGDFHRRGELYLIHRHEGTDLDLLYAERTLEHVRLLWGRPVHLETISENRKLILSYDGQAHSKAVV